MSEINEKFITIYGKLGTEDNRNLGEDIDVKVTVVSIQDIDNQDGTIDRVFKCKLFEEL
jgi:hypothetical protein